MPVKAHAAKRLPRGVGMASELKLQALKENVDTVEVDQVMVHEGDVVTKDQPLLVVQADKASLDVLAPAAGRVSRLLVKSGDELKVGQAYCVIEEVNGEQQASKAPTRAEGKRTEEAPKIGRA